MRGFQKGHVVSEETRAKISTTLSKKVPIECSYCGIEFMVKPSVLKKRKRHFCCRDCYSKYRTELLPKEEQHAYGTGLPEDERKKRAMARSAFNHYLRDKNIKREPCEICGKEAEGHHDDYDKPLDVRWLCFEHHRQWHTIHDNPELMEVE